MLKNRKYIFLIIILLNAIFISCGKDKITAAISRKNSIISRCGPAAMDRTKGYIFYKFSLEGKVKNINDLNIGEVGTYSGELKDGYITEKCLAINASSKKNFYVYHKNISKFFAEIINTQNPSKDPINRKELVKQKISHQNLMRCGLPKIKGNNKTYSIPLDIEGVPVSKNKLSEFEIKMHSVGKASKNLLTNQYGCLQVAEKDNSEIIELIDNKTNRIIYRRGANIWTQQGVPDNFSSIKIDLCKEENKNYFYKGKCTSYFNYLCQQRDNLLLPYQNFFEVLKEMAIPSKCMEAEEDLAQGVNFTSKINVHVSLEALFQFKNLFYIDIKDSQLTDISPLKNLTNLYRLDLSYNQIKDISPLAHLSELDHILLTENNIDDISPLKNLTKLTSLGLDFNKIKNISSLENLINLVETNLSNNQIENISSLKNMKELKFLNLTSNLIVDIKSLKKLTNLADLFLGGNQIADISPLKNLSSLTNTLDLGSNQIKDISSLKNLINLTKLDLGRNQIEDISSLNNLNNLNKLDLSDNKIVDTSSLKNLTSLVSLHLSYNKIDSISSLKNLASLTIFYTSNNRIKEITALKNLSNIKVFSISNNPLGTTIPKTEENCPTDSASRKVSNWCMEKWQN